MLTLYVKYHISTGLAVKYCENMRYNEANSLNLPSKKLFFVALPIILLVGLFVMFHKPSSAQTKSLAGSNDGLQAVSVASQNVITETDSDGDGVPDWEETLWHTDPHNPATYNNEPDAQYIADQIKNAGNPSLSSGPITSTEELSHQLFGEYMSLKQSGGLTPDSIDAMTARLAASVEASGTPVTYTHAQLKTFPDTDSARMQAYADALQQMESQYSTQYSEQTNGDSSTFGDPQFATDMNIASGYYAQFAKALMGVAVPAGAADLHVAYVNALEASAQGLKAFANSTDDPLGGMVGIKEHSDAEDAQAAAISNLSDFLNQNGIIGFSLPTF